MPHLVQVSGVVICKPVPLIPMASCQTAAPVPAVTSDFNEQASESWLHKSIDAIRGQYQRGLPIEAPPLQLIVSFAVLRS